MLSLILLGIGGYVVTMPCIFCLVSASRRADKREERILELMLSGSRDNMSEANENPPVQASEVTIY